MGNTLYGDILRAVDTEHPCSDHSCDIAAAMDAGYILWAAHLLSGATECPETEKALDAYFRHHGDVAYRRNLEDERLSLLGVPHVQCEDCGAINWELSGYMPETCGNCCASL